MSAVAACGASTSASTPGGQMPSPATTTQVSAGSCAGSSASEQFAHAKVVLVGTMLPGPALTFGPRRLLTSPARVRVARYLKGGGPPIIRVVTAVTASGKTVRESEDGIRPIAGERWKIFSDSRRSPLPTSICAGSAHTGRASSSPGPRPASCPARAQRRLARNPWAPAQRQLAPSNPISLRLCRYSGFNAHPASGLVRTKLVSARDERDDLVDQFNRLPPFAPGAIACPFDDGSQILALLGYQHGHRVRIAFALTGCEGVSNGDLTRRAAGAGRPPAFGPQLRAALERLTR